MGADAHPLVADDAFGRPALGQARAWRGAVARAAGLIERETFVVLAVATYATLLLASLGSALGGDGWLLFVAGREIAADGIPLSDPLTVWGGGADWVDQQWAAQLLFYGTVTVGGVKAALLLNVAVLVASFALALAGSRALGASSRAVAAVGLGCVVVGFPHSGLRAQTLAYPLFVATVVLLARAGRVRSHSVLLVLPLLAVWANVHGSVLVGAALVSLFAIVEGVLCVRARSCRYSWPLLTALAAVPWLCVGASPYGLDVVGYYRDTVGNGQFFALIGEWGPSSFPGQAPFLALALATVWCVARARNRLTPFESLVLLVTLVGGLVAIRNIVWFVLAVAVLLPLGLGGSSGDSTAPRRRRLNLALAGVALLAATTMAVRPAPVLESYPAGAADAITRLAAADPSLKIFSNERYADWLIWHSPALAGRVAFDSRFELLSASELRAIATWRGRTGANWKAAARGYGLVVLDRQSEREIAHALLREPGARLIFRDSTMVVVLRSEGR